MILVNSAVIEFINVVLEILSMPRCLSHSHSISLSTAWKPVLQNDRKLSVYVKYFRRILYENGNKGLPNLVSTTSYASFVLTYISQSHSARDDSFRKIISAKTTTFRSTVLANNCPSRVNILFRICVILIPILFSTVR